MARQPTGKPRGRPVGSGIVTERITIRLSSVLLQRLSDMAQGRADVEKGDKLSDVIRDALWHYLECQNKRRTESSTHHAEVLVAVTDMTPPPGTQTDASISSFDPLKHKLGKLCPKKHEHGTSGQSKRYNTKSGSCVQCEVERVRERRAKNRAAHAQVTAG